MAKQPDLILVAKLIPQVERLLEVYKEDSGDFNKLDYDEWSKRLRQADEMLTNRLERLGARVSKNPATNTAISLARIRSTSTSGLSGACGNWLVSARSKVNG